MTGTCLIALNKGLHTWVDVTDLPLLAGVLWHATPIRFSAREAHYAAGRPEGVVAGMHRHLLGRPAGLDVDHIDHDGLNNRRRNLRAISRAANVRNRSHGRSGLLSLGCLPSGVPIITREALRASDGSPANLDRLLAEARRSCAPHNLGVAA